MKMRTNFLTAHLSTPSIAWCSDAIQILIGSLYIALLAQIEIPLTPIPVTLHTFAIFTWALFQGGRKSFYSLLLYLVEATLGLPVFPSAYTDPFWIVGPSAGYCLSFPLAAYFIGKCSESENSFSTKWTIFGLCCGQIVIYLMGVTWLSFSIGWEQAIEVGLVPFVWFDSVKLLAAFSIKMAIQHLLYLHSSPTT